MPENNQILSVEGQLVGMPTAGPESFSQQQLDYLKRALGVDETVLYDGGPNGYRPGTGWSPTDVAIQLSESMMNFELIKIYLGAKARGVHNFIPVEPTGDGDAFNNSIYISTPDTSENNNTVGVLISPVYQDSTKLRFRAGYSATWAAAYRSGEDWGYVIVYKVTGVHRIAGGN